jgi:hypothetical protein
MATNKSQNYVLDEEGLDHLLEKLIRKIRKRSEAKIDVSGLWSKEELTPMTSSDTIDFINEVILNP